MNILKKILIGFLIFLLLILSTLILVPVIFKDEIVQRTKDSVSEQINAKVEFSDVSLSLIRSFPKASLSILNLTIDGINTYQGVRIADVEELQLDFDLLSLVQEGRPIELNSFKLERPRINLITRTDSTSNFDVFFEEKEHTDTVSESNLVIELDDYRISEGYLSYTDKLSATRLEIPSLNHKGRLRYDGSMIDLSTSSVYDSIFYSMGNIAYLNRPSGNIDLDLQIDLDSSSYRIIESKIDLNALSLSSSGTVRQLPDGWDIDLSLSSPGTAFKQLLSLLPGAYTKEFKNVETDGQFEFMATVQGRYLPEIDQIPAFNVRLAVSNGHFKYPSLAYGVDNIQVIAVLDQPGADLNDLSIVLEPFSFEIDDNPFQAAVNIEDPIRDPLADVMLKGTLEVSKIGQVIPASDIKLNKGTIAADIDFRGRRSDLSNKAYDKIEATGDIEIDQLVFTYTNYPQVSIPSGRLTFSPQAVNINETEVLFGRSDASLEGQIDNILAIISGDRSIGGSIRMNSRLIDINEWMIKESPPEPTDPEYIATDSPKVFDRYGLKIDLSADEIIYEDYVFKETKAISWLQGGNLGIENASSILRGNRLKLTGTLDGLVDYLLGFEILRGSLTLSSPRLNLNDFMDTGNSDPNTAQSENYTSIIPVPSDMVIEIQTDLDECIYGNWRFDQMRGKLEIDRSVLSFHQFQGKGFGGSMLFDGTYSTKDLDKPKFDLKYDLQGLAFRETFNNINMLQQLAPIGKFIQGRFNNSMILSGTLGKDLLPVWQSFDAAGMIETRNAVLDQVKPFEKIGDKLNLDYLRDIPIENSKNWFEVTNGVLEIQPIDIRHNDLLFTVKGKHSITQDLDYTIRVKVPREEIEKTSIGQQAGSLWSNIQGEAQKLGVDLIKGNYLVFDFKLTGPIKDPTVNMKFIGTSSGPDGEITGSEESVATKIEDEIKNKVTEEKEKAITQVKDTLQQISDKIRDSLKNLTEEKVAETGRKLKEEIAKSGEDIKGNIADSLKQKLGETGSEDAEAIKDKLGKWNPFKKDKKEEEK